MLTFTKESATISAKSDQNPTGKDIVFEYENISVPGEGGRGRGASESEKGKNLAALTLAETIAEVSAHGYAENVIAKALIQGLTAMNYRDARSSALSGAEGPLSGIRKSAVALFKSKVPLDGGKPFETEAGYFEYLCKQAGIEQ